MRSLLFVCAVLVAANAAAVANSERCECVFNNPYGYRGGAAGSSAQLKSLEERIVKVAARVQEIQNYWDNTVQPQRDAFKARTDDLVNRVHDLEEADGAEGFDCGGDDLQRISRLFVCDGTKDCANGHDEDDATCHAAIAAGTVLKGDHVANDDCTRRRPDKLSIVITSAKRLSWFQNRIQVTANVNVEFNSEDSEATASLPTSGYFWFATRELVLFPPENDRLGITCRFNTDNSCRGHIVHEASGESCADFTLNRQ
jgi:hypothetical protein